MIIEVLRETYMPVTIGGLRERATQETRISLVPEVVEKFAQSGAQVILQRELRQSQFSDSAYKSATWADSADAVLEKADVLLTVQPLSPEQIARLKSGAVVFRTHARHR
jgi:NAD(P) transhydrogenase subunit alpha